MASIVTTSLTLDGGDVASIVATFVTRDGGGMAQVVGCRVLWKMS